MSESGYAKITSHEATLRLWAKTLETMQPKAGKMPTLRIEAELPGDRNDTYTVRMVVLLERDLLKVADMEADK